MPRPVIVFTDLDATLLNHNDYSWAEAKPALDALKQQGIPLILVSSKTAAEMQVLRQALAIDFPYVCENGSLIVIPRQHCTALAVDTHENNWRGDEYSLFCGETREQILTVLEPFYKEYRFCGFDRMTIQDIMNATGLSAEAAALAAQRQASEPIVWQDDALLLAEFEQRLSQHKLRLLKGGRFYHVMGQCDKGDAVRYLLNLYQHRYRAQPFSIALGDSPNDLEMLRQVDAPVIMPHQDGSYMRDDALHSAIHAPFAGAQGWGVSVLSLLEKQGSG